MNPATTTATGIGSFAPLTNTAVSLPSGISFGAPASTNTATFNMPTSTTSSTGTALGFKFGQPATTTPTFGQGLFATAVTSSTNTGASTTTTSFTLGAQTTSAPTGFSLNKPANTTFSLGAQTTSAPTGFSLNKPANTTFSLGAQTTSAPTGFSLNKPTNTTFSLGAQATSAPTGFSLSKPANTTFSSPVTAAALPSSAPATTSTANSNVPVSSAANVKNSNSTVKFSQLEENINKWTIELEEQEKVFMNQVAHINEWDRLLLSNGDKIVSLNNSVEKVKLEQQQLDHELDFIVAQQRELEECLLPLEKEFADITVSDPERDATYRMAENLNSQLRHMAEDLKEIIEDINEKNKNHDTTDPIVQIGRILNAHMNSLQWVDQNTTLIKQQLDQMSKLTEIHRRENDSHQNL